MKIGSKNVLLANSVWFIVIGGGFAFFQDQMHEGYGIDFSTKMSVREHFINNMIGRTTGVMMAFLGFMPLFIMATAKAQTLTNLCSALGIVHVVNIVDFYARHNAFMAKQGVKGVNIQMAVQALLALATFAGADFAMPTCKLADITRGPLETYLGMITLMWGPTSYLFPRKVLDAYQIPSDNQWGGLGGEWVRRSAMWLGLFNMFVCYASFVVFASKDSAAKGKLTQAFTILWAMQFGMVCMLLNSCFLDLHLEQGPMIFNSVVMFIGVVFACRAADKPGLP